jgi:hypothetical protein
MVADGEGPCAKRAQIPLFAQTLRGSALRADETAAYDVRWAPAAASLPPSTLRKKRSYSKSMALKSRSLLIWWRALTWRTVPDLDRMTSDWVVAPRRS